MIGGRAAALLHWQRFRAAVAAMAPEEAAPLLSTVAAEIEAIQTPSYCAIWRT